MAEKTLKLLWKAVNSTLAQRGPRVLEFLDRDGKTQFFIPEVDADGNVIYEVDIDYGRRLLAGHADRFFLLSPSKVVIKRRRKDNMGAEYVTVHAIASGAGTSAMVQLDPAPAEKTAQRPQEGPEGTPTPAQGTDGAAEGATAPADGQAAPEAATDTMQSGKTVQKGGSAAHPEKHKPGRPQATA